MGYMKWCCFWNTVYDGTIASGIHMLISTFTYIGMCLALMSFATHYGGEATTDMAYNHRVHRQQQERNYYQSISHLMGEADPPPKEQPVDKESFRRPLLTELERDLYVYSSLFMIGLNVPILITSLLLIVGAVTRKPKIMFLWVVSMVPYLIIDTIYHSFLFYTLLGFTDLDALQGFLWFQLWTVMIIMFWVFRCAFDVYAILCVMSYRNEILRSGKSKVKNLGESTNGSVSGQGANSEATMSPKTGSAYLKKGEAPPDKDAPVGSAVAAMAKSGLASSATLFSSSFGIGQSIDEDSHKQHLEALHNAAATADVHHQLLLMSAAQHLAAASGLLAPAALGTNSHYSNTTAAVGMNQQQQQHLAQQKSITLNVNNSNNLTMVSSVGTHNGMQNHQTVLPGANTSQPNLIDFGNTLPLAASAGVGGSSLGLPGSIGPVASTASLVPLGTSQLSIPGALNRQLSTSGQQNTNPSLSQILGPDGKPLPAGQLNSTRASQGQVGPFVPQAPHQKRPLTGWGMSKYLLKQQQQALAIATGLHKSGILPPNTPLVAVAEQALAEQREGRASFSIPGAPRPIIKPAANANVENLTPLTGESKRYAKQWLKMNLPAMGSEDFTTKPMMMETKQK